jgi:hypothetical protein
VISSPSTYQHVQQELIAEIYQTHIWPVVVAVGGNISKHENIDFIDRDGNYIILIPDGQYESLATEIYELVLGQGKYKRIWNSESRFVVAGANEISMSQQVDIFAFLSGFRIYNCIIVSPEHYVIDKENSRPINENVAETGMKLGVYTWFPYQSSNRCTEVNDITLLDSWVIVAQGHFTKNIDFFPRKVNKSLNGCPLKAVVRDGHNYFTTRYFNHTYSNGNVVSYIEGLELKLLLIVSQQMNMTFVNVPTPEGFETEQASVYNLVIAFIANKAYIFLGDVSTQSMMPSVFDTTNSHYWFYTKKKGGCVKTVRAPNNFAVVRDVIERIHTVLRVATLCHSGCLKLAFDGFYKTTFLH